MTLKVCHVISGDLWAGAEVMALHLLLGLSRRPGIDLFVILLNHGTLADELEKNGVITCVFDERKLSFPEIVRSAAMVTRKWSPDVLHAHRYKENLLSYLVSFALKKKPVLISTQHGMAETYGSGVLRRSRLYANLKLLAWKFDSTVAVSSDMKDSLTHTHGFQQSRVAVIRNGIAIPEPGKATDTRAVLVVGAAGRLTTVKDYPLMIETAKQVCAKLSNVRFEVAGDGPLMGELQALVRGQGLQSAIQFRGFVSDILAFYAGLDVLINTSFSEGVPMSVLEAMALGVPPIAPAVGGLPEIITDCENGFLIHSRDPSLFADRCIALCTNSSLRASMARAARKRVIEAFSVQRMVDGYFDLYSSFAARRHGARNHDFNQSKDRAH